MACLWMTAGMRRRSGNAGPVDEGNWVGGRILGAPPTPRSLEELHQVALEQRYLVTRTQCFEAGMTPKAVEHRLATKRWRPKLPGVYLVQPGADDWWTDAVAAHLACGPAAAWSRATAARAWGLTRSEPRRIEILMDMGHGIRRPPGVVVRRTRHLGIRLDPLRWPWLTTVEETILDLAESGSQDEVFALLGRAFQKGLTTEAVVLSRLAARSRHPRRALLREVLGEVGEGAESAMEVRYLRDVERAHGLPRGIRQLRVSPTRFAVHDVGYEPHHVLIELDGRLGHDGWEGRRSDGARDRHSAGDGWLTLRAYWLDVAVSPCRLAVEIGRVLQSRGWIGSPSPCRRIGCEAR